MYISNHPQALKSKIVKESAIFVEASAITFYSSYTEIYTGMIQSIPLDIRFYVKELLISRKFSNVSNHWLIKEKRKTPRDQVYD